MTLSEKKPEQPKTSFGGYVIARNYRSASIFFYSLHTKRCIGTLKMIPSRSFSRKERYSAIAEFLRENPVIGFSPSYIPTKEEIKKAKL